MPKFLYPIFILFCLHIDAQEKQENQQIISDTLTKQNTLNEVVILSNIKKHIKITNDKTTITTKDNALLSSGTSMEAIKRIPGVITTPTGNLSLNGKNVTMYIDGSPSVLSNTDLQSYLASLPANIIEKVELINNPNASYETGSNGAIINIVTQSKRLEGVNANVTMNYGFNKHFKISPQIALNGRNKDFSWQTVLGYNYIENDLFIKNDQQFTASNPVVFLTQKKSILTANRNVFFRVGTSYQLTSKSNILFNYNGNFAKDRNDYETNITGNNINYSNNGVTNSKDNNHEISLQFQTKLDDKGRNLDIVAFNNIVSKSPFMHQLDNTNSINTAINSFKLNNKYIQFDFNIPFEESKITLLTGGKYNDTKVNNTGIYSTENNAQTIDFKYSESNLAFYAEASKKINNLDISAGIRFEDFSISRETNSLTNSIAFKNTGFFPHASILYTFNDNINTSASYSKKINQPNYFSLDPNNSNGFDSYNNSGGNPLLQPSFSDNYDFKISAYQYVNLALNYTVAKDNNFIVYNTLSDGQIISNLTFQQFKKTNSFSANLSFPLPLDYLFKSKEEFENRRNDMSKMNYLFLNINYSKFMNSEDAIQIESKPIVNYSVQSQILLPAQIKTEINYLFLSKGTWQVYQIIKPIQQLDISFSRKFINQKLNVGLHVTDVFNSNSTNALISGNNLNTNFYKKEDSRMFKIALTYNFGNLKLESKNTQIETEKITTDGGFVN